jgi:hypothetical protein
LNEAEIEEFAALASKSDWQGLPRLIVNAKSIAEVYGAQGILRVAKVGDKFGWATCELYDTSLGIIKRWNLDGFDKIIELGDKIKKNYCLEENLDACHHFWGWAAKVPEDKKIEFLDKKVNGLIEGFRRMRKACEPCMRDYFNHGDISTYYYCTKY